MVDANGQPANLNKGSIWKAAYHDGRVDECDRPVASARGKSGKLNDGEVP